MNNREEYLLSLIPEDLDYVEKYWSNFEKYARYMGNGVYSWKDMLSNSTSELFYMGILRSEQIKFEQL